MGILLSAIDSGQAVQFPHRPSRTEPYTTRTVEPWGVVTDQRPLVSRRPRPRPRRHPHLPALPHRRRRHPDRPGRRRDPARRRRPARDRRPTPSESAPDRASGPGLGRRRPRHRAARAGPPSSARGSSAAAPARRSTVDIGMRDRLAREIAGYGADAVVLEPAVAARRRAGPAPRTGRPGDGVSA